MNNYFHSVTLDENKCRGCTNCIKRCPTEAIRVRKSKARIINERCIDCGECIRICPYHAKKAITDPFDAINNFQYKIALPAPAFYSQFKPSSPRDKILNALIGVGFDDVFEVAKAAEIVTCATRDFIAKNKYPRPLISSACPAIVRLIQVRFPSLLDNLVPLDSPMELAAKMAKQAAAKKTGMDFSQIGTFFITPCAAKMTSIRSPYGKNKSMVDGAISIKEIYLKVLQKLNSQNLKQLIQAGSDGISWALSGGEAGLLNVDNYLSVDGIHNVITILEEVENERLEDVDFIEALACTGGCLGGPLNVENVYVANTQLKQHINMAKKYNNTICVNDSNEYEYLRWTQSVEHKSILMLDDDLDEAMKKLETLERIYEQLPGLDCGACGAPSCRALSEDIVRGNADETDCVFKLREKVRTLARQMIELEAKMPPVLDKEGNINKEE